MTRHVIIGRFGVDDNADIPQASDEVVSTLQLVAGKRLDHGIGRALADLHALYMTPSEFGADLLRLSEISAVRQEHRAKEEHVRNARRVRPRRPRRGPSARPPDLGRR